MDYDVFVAASYYAESGNLKAWILSPKRSKLIPHLHSLPPEDKVKISHLEIRL